VTTASTVGMDDFGHGECQIELCVQAAVDGSHLCRYHLKVALGLTRPPGKEPENLVRVGKARLS
jgi:hypothetical protein